MQLIYPAQFVYRNRSRLARHEILKYTKPLKMSFCVVFAEKTAPLQGLSIVVDNFIIVNFLLHNIIHIYFVA